MLPFLLAALDDTPEKTIQAFIAAFNALDGRAMASRVVGGKPFDIPRGNNAHGPDLKAKIGKVTIDGDSATVELQETMGDGRGGTTNYPETVHLRRVGGDWKIEPTDPRTGAPNQNPISSIAYATRNSDMFLLAKRAAKKTACLSNVKQLATATLIWSGDHDDKLPKTSAGWKAAIMPYLKNEQVFHCPDDPSGKDSYFLDPRVAGRAFSSIARPADTAMIVEGTVKKTAFRHDGKCMIGYTDGHAKIADPARVRAARTVSLK